MRDPGIELNIGSEARPLDRPVGGMQERPPERERAGPRARPSPTLTAALVLPGAAALGRTSALVGGAGLAAAGSRTVRGANQREDRRVRVTVGRHGNCVVAGAGAD